MSVRISNCQKCNRPLERGARRKLAVMSEIKSGYFSCNGFAMYLCPECSRKLIANMKWWCGE